MPPLKEYEKKEGKVLAALFNCAAQSGAFFGIGLARFRCCIFERRDKNSLRLKIQCFARSVRWKNRFRSTVFWSIVHGNGLNIEWGAEPYPRKICGAYS